MGTETCASDPTKDECSGANGDARRRPAAYPNITGYSLGCYPLHSPGTSDFSHIFLPTAHWTLEESVVFHMHVSADGIAISETVLVTETGHECLTRSPCFRSEQRTAQRRARPELGQLLPNFRRPSHIGCDEIFLDLPVHTSCTRRSLTD